MDFDTIVAALTLGVAGLPVASLVWNKPSGKILALAFVLSSGTAFGVFFLAQTYWPEARGEHVVEDRPVESVEDGFVSSTTCRSCHPRNHATWYQSYHRTMTQVATPETVVGRFDGVEQIAYDNKKFRLGRTGDEFWFEGPDLSQPGKRMRKRIVMTTGLHHMQAYWYATGNHREVGIVPLFYLMEDQRWAPSYSTFLRPPHAEYAGETGGWNRVCQRCHATGVQPRILDPDAPDTRVAEFGIACEACHGRAEEHVRINRDPRRRYRLHFSDDPDPTIVNPSRLSPRLASQICGQCHSISTPKDVEKWKQLGYPYRPGSDLMTTRFVSPGKLDREDLGAEDRSTLERILKFGPTFLKDRFWDDGMVRISGREYHGLLDSPCYKDADSEDRMLSCLSCHTMHQAAEDSRPVKEWANDQLTSGMDGDEACLQCHESFAAGLTSHTHHRADSEGSRCYNCHMPHTTYGLLKAIRSHTIDSPNVAVDLETGRPNACNLCHLDKDRCRSGRG